MGIVCTKLRDSARGRHCSFEIPGICKHDSETTVLCHAPSEVKGMGNKGDDYFAAFGCFECHNALDQHRVGSTDRLFYWLRGIQRTQAVWVAAGLIVLPVDLDTAKKRPKRKANLPSRKLQSRNNLKSRTDLLSRGQLARAGNDEE